MARTALCHRITTAVMGSAATTIITITIGGAAIAITITAAITTATTIVATIIEAADAAGITITATTARPTIGHIRSASITGITAIIAAMAAATRRRLTITIRSSHGGHTIMPPTISTITAVTARTTTRAARTTATTISRADAAGRRG
jgi:hypothetical protein